MQYKLKQNYQATNQHSHMPGEMVPLQKTFYKGQIVNGENNSYGLVVNARGNITWNNASYNGSGNFTIPIEMLEIITDNKKDKKITSRVTFHRIDGEESKTNDFIHVNSPTILKSVIIFGLSSVIIFGIFHLISEA